MRCLITGGSGFIGSHLSEILLERGYQVTIVDDMSSGRHSNIEELVNSKKVSFVEGTVTDEALMDRLISDSDVVFHLAAAVGVEMIMKDPVHCIETNIFGTQSVLKIAAKYSTKVLIASTSEIYGKGEKVPFSEEDDRVLGPTTKARWSYATSKAVDEFLGLAYHNQFGLPVVLFRLFNTVGPRQTGRYGMVVPRFVEKAVKGEPLQVYGDGEQTRCFCDVRDTVRAIVALSEVDEAVGQVYNIGGTNEISILDLAKKVIALVHGEEANASDYIKFVPYDEAYESGFEDMRRRVPDTKKIKNAINWEPQISLEGTLRSVMEHGSLS